MFHGFRVCRFYCRLKRRGRKRPRHWSLRPAEPTVAGFVGLGVQNAKGVVTMEMVPQRGSVTKRMPEQRKKDGGRTRYPREKEAEMEDKRVKTGLSVKPSVLELCDKNLGLAEVKSRNDFVEKAIRFYAGYLNAETNPDFFDKIFIGRAEKEIKKTGNKLSRGQYKIAVELAKLSYLLASDRDMSYWDLQALDEQCKNEVLRRTGTIRLEDIKER